MIIEINKDVEKFKETVFFGLTAKQSISALLSLIVGSAVVLLLKDVIGLVASAYVAVPAVAPIALGGFYSYNGMSFFELWRRRIRFMFFNRPLLYVSTEDEDRAEKAKKEILKKTKDEVGLYGLKKRKGTNKMIKTVIICIVVTTMAALYWVLYGKGINR